MIEIKQETETSAIATLESEIETRRTDIERLREAIATLEAGRIRPFNPEADSAFTLLVELIGAAPSNLEQQQVYDAKLQAARLSLKLATEICEQKQAELKLLQQENRQEQADVLLQELLVKAGMYNAAIDESFNLLIEMKMLNSQITQLRGDRLQVFEVVADLNETPFCQIGGDRVKVRRRFDVKRE
ncbi:hypothetical protein [Chlorogloea sp. CCALA 695]|uniref:hypothetical protein n=1 Tax=Chlorogloea sp. CCALA 695 TaxID=2107693 RepID=UPI000D085CB5|nr:hypothetical protein [Chlorogloea sp. CCALA 695]PSB27953.1 hypothetical protein C7B70_21660 [Chlorogloea sp. CCALA 695]